MYPYSYSMLRYVHDTATGEFVNVGVALFSPKGRFVGARCRKTYRRVARVFPGLNAEAFKSSMRFIESRFKDLGERASSELPIDPKANILEFAKSILPLDDSSLQWSPLGSGITKDPRAELEKLFERMVERYDERNLHERRTDDEVWRDFKRQLEARQPQAHHILDAFQSKRIRVHDDEVEFQHAWKNGVWHCLEPVSFDLSSPDTIREKAHRWLGQITSISSAPDRFKVYFLVGAPQSDELRPAFERALSILGKAPVENEIYLEDKFSELTDRIEGKVRSHQ